MQLQLGNLNHPAVQQILLEHLAHLRTLSPEGSVHALDLNALRAPEIELWTVWQNNQIMGCGALKILSTENTKSAELKSMRTASLFLRQGVAQLILSHLIEQAKRHRIQTLYLETGPAPAFSADLNLYKKNGFEICGPFANYRPDPFSVFMKKNLFT
jgi:putative acetyltransferase